MNLREAQPWELEFRQDVGELFRLFALPRMEYHSRGNTGFWDTTESHEFGTLFLSQVRKNLIYIIRTHFEDTNSEMETALNDVLGNYMHGQDELTITFHFKPRCPIGIELIDTFTEGKKIATIERRRGENEESFSEPDKTGFDWLYGTYTQGRTDTYGDVSSSITLSIRNTRDYVDYSADAEDYNTKVYDWETEKSTSRLNQLLS